MFEANSRRGDRIRDCFRTDILAFGLSYILKSPTTSQWRPTKPYAMISSATSPSVSVSRKFRPAYR